jgi:hypothetical protein
MSIAVVADGHGSDNCFRSEHGSRFASESALRGIRDFLTEKNKTQVDYSDTREFDKELRALVKNIVWSWHKKVIDQYPEVPVTDEEMRDLDVAEKYRKRYLEQRELHHAYGSTLIAAAVTQNCWFGFHIGDGKCTALYQDGEFYQPIPWDERCYLNVTTSICDDDAPETARIYYCPRTDRELPVAVFVNSDGVDDTYPINDNEKHLAKFYRTIVMNFAEEAVKDSKTGWQNGVDQVRDFLPVLTQKGSGDDVSIAGFIDLGALGKTYPLLKEQITEGEPQPEAREPQPDILASELPPQARPPRPPQEPGQHIDVKG